MSTTWTAADWFAAMSGLIDTHVFWNWLIERPAWRGEQLAHGKPGVAVRLNRRVIVDGVGDCWLYAHVIRAASGWVKPHSHTKPFCSFAVEGNMEVQSWMYSPLGDCPQFAEQIVRPGDMTCIIEPDRIHTIHTSTPEVLTLVLVGPPYESSTLCQKGIPSSDKLMHSQLGPGHVTAWLNRFIHAYVRLRQPQLADPNWRQPSQQAAVF